MLLLESEEEAKKLAGAWTAQVDKLRAEIAQKQRVMSGLLKMLDGLGALWPAIYPLNVEEQT